MSKIDLLRIALATGDFWAGFITKPRKNITPKYSDFKEKSQPDEGKSKDFKLVKRIDFTSD